MCNSICQYDTFYYCIMLYYYIINYIFSNNHTSLGLVDRIVVPILVVLAFALAVHSVKHRRSMFDSDIFVDKNALSLSEWL